MCCVYVCLFIYLPIIYFPCVRVHTTRKDMHAYLQTTREGVPLISSNPEIPHCHNKGASLLK